MTELSTVLVPVIAVYGTWAGDFNDADLTEGANPAHWWHPMSSWWIYLAALGRPGLRFVPFRADDFVWTGALDGVSFRALWNWIRRQPAQTRHVQWRAGGEALVDYIAVGVQEGRPDTRFLVIAHSHGGQVALYCAATGRTIPILITVSTPHRFDMRAVTASARPQIGLWVHLYDPERDDTGHEGALMDGAISWDRTQPMADVNVACVGCSHSGALNSPALFHTWSDCVLPVILARLDSWRTPLIPQLSTATVDWMTRGA